MHVGIIIPAYNAARWLCDSLRSVLSQTHRDWSLIVIDDGSTDSTIEIAGLFVDPRIRLTRQPNGGVSAARNRGLAALAADAVLFLDADDWLAPEALAILTDTLTDCPWAVAAVSGYARITAGGLTRRVAPPPSGELLPRLLVGNLFANGGHVLIRRQSIDAAGEFDTALTYGEDWEYWTRLALQGKFISVRTPEPLLFVRERVGSAYHSMATNPASFVPSMNAVYRNPAIAERVGVAHLLRLRRRAEAEVAWIIGRELIRHRRAGEGKPWLVQSFRDAPGLRRLALLGLSRLEMGPFRPYEGGT